ncbi:hypothetical protein OAT18_00370 [Tenacibaculum sp.]|nr:hypothetical protein [Tenacibaculum sp.]
MKRITKKNLEQNLKEATSTLLEMARKSCWNKIHENTSYIISEIKESSPNRIERKKENEKKELKTLKKVTSELKLVYENLYDINLYIYKSEKEKTIIEIQYYPKSLLDSKFYKTVKRNTPMLHMKVGIPPYVNNKTEKFDVNWELGGIRYLLNLFWWRLKFKWKYRSQIKNVG